MITRDNHRLYTQPVSTYLWICTKSFKNLLLSNIVAKLGGTFSMFLRKMSRLLFFYGAVVWDDE